MNAEDDGAAEAESSAVIDRLLVLAKDWAAAGRLTASGLADLMDEVDLPARLYAAAVDALAEAGITIDSDPEKEESGETGEAAGGFNADGLSVFMHRSRHRILTAAEEVELGRRMERGRLARQALDMGRELTAEDHRHFMELVRDGQRAGDEFALHNIRLVIHLAARARQQGTPALEFEDLIQEGYLGLTRAIEKWDHTRGLKFSTYATWWIRQSLARAVADKAATIRLPVHVVEALRRILRAEQQLSLNGSKPTLREIAARAELPAAKVKELLGWRNRVDSLHRVLGTDTELHELIQDPGTSGPEAHAERAMLREAIEQVLGDLKPKEAAIIRRRFGLDDGAPQTLEQIGQDLGVTRERIRQIEAKAMEHLRHPIRQKLLQDYMEVG